MKTHTALIPAALLTALIALFVAGLVGAAPPAQGPGTAGSTTLAATVASKISYQGRLTDAGGNPLNGSYNLIFQLWNDATAGSQVGADIVKNGVAVNNGLFTVELDVPQSAFDGQALWLRIQVNGQWLTPRQELLPVPYALSLRPGANIKGSGSGAITTVINQGLGTAFKAQGGGIGIEGSGMTGVRGDGDVGVRGSGIVGVRGEGNPGSGVEGTSTGGSGVVGSTSAPVSADAAGVYGSAGDVTGVKGTSVSGPGGVFSSTHGLGAYVTTLEGYGLKVQSGDNIGVFAHSGRWTNPIYWFGHIGVFGIAEEGVGVSGRGETGGTFTGQQGVSASGVVTGVVGTAYATNGWGVVGIADNYNSIGVHGRAIFGTGVAGTGEIGVKGISNVGMGVRGEGFIGVDGFSQAGTAVQGESASGDGVRGESATGVGVLGKQTGSGNYAELGRNSDAIHAVAWSGQGVYAQAPNDDGVWGDSGAANKSGVYGSHSGTGYGVTGRSAQGTGVQGFGTTGVYGESQVAWGQHGQAVYGHGIGSDTEGVLGESDQATGVYGVSSGKVGNAFGVWGETAATWGLYTNQNLYVGGNCTGCTVAFVGQNGDASTLEVGDVVSISGIAPPLKGQPTPVLVVQRATVTRAGGLGVVQSRAVVTASQVPVLSGDSDQMNTREVPSLAVGRVSPGEYLFVVVQGLVQVQADASSTAIEVGDGVGPADKAGIVQKLSQSAPTAPMLGRALEPLAKGTGLIWVLVLGR